jgi:hypothetical protein
MTSHAPQSKQPFIFQRYGGSFQVRIRSYADMLAIRQLPEVHWIALACPTEGLACDPRFISFLDWDGNKRVRVHELIEAITWLDSMICDPAACVPGSDVLVLASLSPPASALRQTAELVLDNLRAADRTRISLTQVRQTEQILGKGDSNGDGVIAPAGVSDPDLRSVVEDVLKHLPGVVDVGGEAGINQATIKTFRETRALALAWHDARSSRYAWGEQSLERALLVRRLTPRLDEYFLQCRLVASQPDAAGQMRVTTERIGDLLGHLDRLRQTLAALPVAPADAVGRLTWASRYRGDAWEALEQLRVGVARDLFAGAAESALDEAQWDTIKAEAKPILDWHDESERHPVLKLGVDRLRAIDERYLDALDQLSANDKKLGELLAQIGNLEKLILYQRWMFTFVNNFVSMPDLYRQETPALFEQGMLIMSGREFTLAVLVPNRAAHIAYAAESSMCTMYVEITGGTPSRQFEVAVPVTWGTSKGLFAGKRGVFRYRDGVEYDAVVVHMHLQPVSLWEAIVQPFSKIGKFFTSRIEKLSASMDGDFEKHVTAQATSVTAPPVIPAPAPKPGQPQAAAGNMGTMLMGGGVAFAAIGSSLAFVLNQVSSIPLTSLLFGLFVVCMLLAIPTSLLAFLKLRRRNLAMVLEASGWALNDRLKLTSRLGRLFTRRSPRPKGSRISFTDELSHLIPLNRGDSTERTIWSWLLPVMVVSAIAVAGVWAWWSYGPTEHGTRRRIEAQIADLASFLKVYPDVQALYASDHGGMLLLRGSVASDEQKIELLKDIERTKPAFLVPPVLDQIVVRPLTPVVPQAPAPLPEAPAPAP